MLIASCERRDTPSGRSARMYLRINGGTIAGGDGSDVKIMRRHADNCGKAIIAELHDLTAPRWLRSSLFAGRKQEKDSGGGSEFSVAAYLAKINIRNRCRDKFQDRARPCYPRELCARARALESEERRGEERRGEEMGEGRGMAETVERN